ncbi:MAG: hypothetical protein NVV74_10605 [Magnetospirillum sp.]|nr:hypothetical protein [Magnetospirillum sp.]
MSAIAKFGREDSANSRRFRPMRSNISVKIIKYLDVPNGLQLRALLPRYPAHPQFSYLMLISKTAIRVCFSSFVALAGSVMALAASIAPEPARNDDGSFGLRVRGNGLADVTQLRPLQVEVWDDSTDSYTALHGSYEALAERGAAWEGRGSITGAKGQRFEFVDQWIPSENEIRLVRTVTVKGDASGGFRTSITFELDQPLRWPDVEWFFARHDLRKFRLSAQKLLRRRKLLHRR